MIDLEKVKAIQNDLLTLKSSSLGKDDFLRLFAEKTASTLNVYFVGIHFVDQLRENLVFCTGNGQIGEKLRKYKHTVKLREKSFYADQISPAAYNGEIRLVDWLGFKIVSYKVLDNKIFEINLDNISDQYFCSPLLPESRTELYLPLQIRGQTIGILEFDFSVKSTFLLSEIEELQLLANELAGLID